MSTNKRNRAVGGFSLIEIMAVIVIIGLLLSGVTVMVMSRVKKARVEQVKIDLMKFEGQIQEYMLDHSDRPPTSLDDLVSGKYIKEVPKDPWSGNYEYRVSGKRWSVTSYGADMAPGGTDDDEDRSVTNAPANAP